MTTHIIDLNEYFHSSINYDIEGEPMTYNRAPDTELALGRSFNPIDLKSIKRPGISFVATKLDHGAPFSSYDILYVHDFVSLQDELKVDRTVSASYLSNNFESSSKHSYDNSFSSESVSILIKVFADYGRWALNPESSLTGEAQKLLDSDPIEFSNVYGTRYVASERRMNAVFIFLTLSSVSASLKNIMQSTLSVGLGIGKLTATAKEAINHEIKNTTITERLSINAYSIGGKGLAGFKDLALTKIKTVDNPLTQIAEALSSTIALLDETNAVPYAFNIADMRNMGLRINIQVPWTYERAKELLNLKRIYDDAFYKFDILKGIKNKTHNLYFLIDDDEAVSLMTNRIEEYESFLLEISKCHLNCRNNPDPSSYRWDGFVPEIIRDTYLDFLKVPWMQYNGIILDKNNEASSVDLNIMEQILNEPPETRSVVINNFFPQSKGFGVTIQHAGSNVNVMKLFDAFEGYNPFRNYRWKLNLVKYTGRPGGFPLYKTTGGGLEDIFFKGDFATRRPKIKPGEHFEYSYRLYCTLIDKAKREFTYLIMETEVINYWNQKEVLEVKKLKYYPSGNFKF